MAGGQPVNRTITGFHRDDADDWVAELDCGHRQHMRHNPPFTERAWVESEDRRNDKLGERIECRLCDRLEMPEGVAAYRTTPDFDVNTVPSGLLRNHTTKTGVWGRIKVLAGTVRYMTEAPAARTIRLEAGDNAAIPPELPHRVELSTDAKFHVVFLKRPA